MVKRPSARPAMDSGDSTRETTDLPSAAAGSQPRASHLDTAIVDRSHQNMLDLSHLNTYKESLDFLDRELRASLASCPDPAMALVNLERFLAAMPRQDAFLSTWRRNPRVTEALLRLFSTSQYLSELLIGEPRVAEWLIAGPERYDRAGLFERLWDDLAQARDDEAQLAILRRFRHHQMLRIGYGDVVRGQPLEAVTSDLSHLAEACVEAAFRVARGSAAARHGEARGPDGRPLRFGVLALGKLGGEELNYSSDIDLIFVYESEGSTSGPKAISNSEFFSRIGSDLIRLLSEHTSLGRAYRVDMRLRPEGHQGPLARSLATTIGYYETSGRTWERQALIKCRPIAGDLSLGREFLEAITPFVYRRYLSSAEILEIKALKRRIEARTRLAGDDLYEVKTGRGGIRDVEFVVQFLQLLHGGDNKVLRQPNTLAALGALMDVGCVTAEERAVMDDTYRFLRKVEHRLQMLYDRQTHSLPRDTTEQRALALRLGYSPASSRLESNAPADQFLCDYREKTGRNRRILDHVLHDSFGADTGLDSDAIIDLVLDPDPHPELITDVLGRYPFREPTHAYRSLMALAHEDIEFLSQPRCRHFLAAIAPALVRAIIDTPDPDMTLVNLERVSASLGAKAVLWELFSLNHPSLHLYVELCANSQFLCEILMNNPGMIDDLIDSLVVDRPQPPKAIRVELLELCRGAEDLDRILMSFRNKEWLRIATRDILNREPIRDVARELSNVADAIVRQVSRAACRGLVQRVGIPCRASDAKPASWAVLALGKLGGREIIYHSDLDLVFVFDEEGAVADTRPEVSNSRFFAFLSQRVVSDLAGGDKAQALYHVDTRLRHHGSSGPLAVSLRSLFDYYQGPARSWEHMALARARILYSTGSFGPKLQSCIQEILRRPTDATRLAQDVVEARLRIAESRNRGDLKRAPGGLMDIELLVRMLQLVHAARLPGVLRQNTWDALRALKRAGVLNSREFETLDKAYERFRTIEARLRIVHNQSEVALPDSPEAIRRLARRLDRGIAPGETPPDAFLSAIWDQLDRVRSLVDDRLASLLPTDAISRCIKEVPE